MNVWGTDKANVARLDNGAGIGFDQSYATAWFSNEVGCIKHDYVTELCLLVIASDSDPMLTFIAFCSTIKSGHWYL